MKKSVPLLIIVVIFLFGAVNAQAVPIYDYSGGVWVGTPGNPSYDWEDLQTLIDAFTPPPTLPDIVDPYLEYESDFDTGPGDGGSWTTFGTIDVSGHAYLTLKNNTEVDLFFVGHSEIFSFEGMDHDLSHYRLYNPVPEPATILLLGSGLAGLVTLRRRSRNK